VEAAGAEAALGGGEHGLAALGGPSLAQRLHPRSVAADPAADVENLQRGCKLARLLQ
jgi:hypothetical protein